MGGNTNKSTKIYSTGTSTFTNFFEPHPHEKLLREGFYSSLPEIVNKPLTMTVELNTENYNNSFSLKSRQESFLLNFDLPQELLSTLNNVTFLSANLRVGLFFLPVELLHSEKDVSYIRELNITNFSVTVGADILDFQLRLANENQPAKILLEHGNKKYEFHSYFLTVQGKFELLI